jgi:hypothetical protein
MARSRPLDQRWVTSAPISARSRWSVNALWSTRVRLATEASTVGDPVGLDDDRVREGPEQRLEPQDVGRRLEDPVAGRRSPLQVLEESPMEVVGRREVGAGQPRLIRGHVVGRVKARARKRGAHDGDALERQLGTQGMDPLEIRRDPVEPRQAPRGTADTGIRLVARAIRGR